MLLRCSIAACALLLAASGARAAETPDCLVGSYRLADGRIVDIAPSDPPALRWRLFDGTTGALHKRANSRWASTLGWTERSDGISVAFSNCDKGRIDFGGVSGKRIPLEVRDTTFQSHGITLAGRLVMPAGEDKVPIVVLLHGSEHDSAIETYSLQRMLPAEGGVGVFVYDKRSTGKSGGKYTQDFSLLADDAVAAAQEARRLAGARLSRIGYQAGSQGGWVAPIAAARTPVDFVVVCYGLAVSVIDEDQEAVDLQLSEKGYGAAQIAKALDVATAAEAVIASDFKSGIENLDALRAKYRDAPWYKDLRGDYTWFLLPHSAAKLRTLGPEFDWNTPFYYDPMETLQEAKAPQLWIIGGEDYEAPSARTRRRLDLLIAEDRPFTVAWYPRAEHGMTLFETAPDGSRLSTRYAPGYFKMIRDFIRDGRLQGAYGDAELNPPSRR